ncbi:unnamed protein product, partial [marine sediment metagenome]
RYFFGGRTYKGRHRLNIVIMTRTEEGNIITERPWQLLKTIPRIGDVVNLEKNDRVRKFKVKGHIINARDNFLEAVFLEVQELGLIIPFTFLNKHSQNTGGTE